MSVLINRNECDTFHASMYLFRSIQFDFVEKKMFTFPSSALSVKPMSTAKWVR